MWGERRGLCYVYVNKLCDCRIKFHIQQYNKATNAIFSNLFTEMLVNSIYTCTQFDVEKLWMKIHDFIKS